MTAIAQSLRIAAPPIERHVARSASRAFSSRNIFGAALGALVSLGIWFGVDAQPSALRFTLIFFAIALIAWSVLRLPETPVALTAGLGLVAVGAISPEAFYRSLGHEFIWLLIGAFVLATVLRQSGLAERYAARAIGGTGTVRQLFYRLTWVIAATALVIPSTSGRAALLLPLFLTLTASISDRGLRRALALLFPSVILLSACASLLGAGAHLVAVEFMAQAGLPRLSYFDWLFLAAPFALASSFAATEIILRLFLDPAARSRALSLAKPSNAPLTAQQRNILAVTGFTVALWACGAWHGLDAALVALGGAMLATWKTATGVSIKEALKGVEWNLILFLAATLVLGEALLQSGAARWLAESAVRALPAQTMTQPTLVLAVAVVIAMLAHLVITSRTARAMVLIPTVALPLSTGELNGAVLILLTAIASGFCQTFSVSAKPVALYAKLDTPTYTDSDLMRLSCWLMPIFAALLLAVALWLWPLQGMAVLV